MKPTKTRSNQPKSSGIEESLFDTLTLFTTVGAIGVVSIIGGIVTLFVKILSS